MADVQDGNEAIDIKLFGTIISILNNHKNIPETTTDQNSNKSLSDNDNQEKRSEIPTDQVSNKSSSDSETLEKRPKKPETCPRCKSTETKFCYFNNYNVNQPRHFCRGCQRYWTAGGALRAVPVGARCRKNKQPCFFEDSSGGQRVDFDNVAEWRLAEVDEGFEHVSPGKRRRSVLGDGRS